MQFLIGIDDTDNLESRGTGYRARMLGSILAENGTLLQRITRHQLFVNDLIPYTSHNSSACLVVETNLPKNKLIEICSQFLVQESAEGSDAGLCIATPEQMTPTLAAYGNRAKREVLHKQEAIDLAKQQDISLTEHTGTGIGIIGSLAAVALHAEGNDGRFLWLPGLRETSGGTYTVKDLLKRTGIERCISLEGTIPDPDAFVTVEDWFRPILLDHKSTLLVEELSRNADRSYWTASSKEVVKQY